MSSLSALVDIIATQVKALEAAYATARQPVPSLDEPFSPDALDTSPAADALRRTIIAAADQLICTVRSPVESIQLGAVGVYTTTTLAIVEDANVADILAPAGSQGLHINDIRAQCHLQKDVIARLLRYLATRHIFTEVSPDVFANNRLSTLLLKNKSVAEIKADPVARYDRGPFAGFVSKMADESLRSAPFISAFLKDPGQSEAPFNMAHQTPLKLWEWYAQPGNEWRQRRFASLMAASAAHFPQEILVHAFDGKSLKNDSLVVDVGGSIGTAVLTLYNAYPHLKYVVQDLPTQAENATSFWESEAPKPFESGRVTFQGHDFFHSQPVKDAAIYFVRLVIHDWPDSKAKVILQNLRDAAGPSSRLVVLDLLATHVCADENVPSHAPAPLLANLGIGGSGLMTAVDVEVLTLCNGRERTEADFRALGESAGWKLESVKPGILATYVFLPI